MILGEARKSGYLARDPYSTQFVCWQTSASGLCSFSYSKKYTKNNISLTSLTLPRLVPQEKTREALARMTVVCFTYTQCKMYETRYR